MASNIQIWLDTAKKAGAIPGNVQYSGWYEG